MKKKRLIGLSLALVVHIVLSIVILISLNSNDTIIVFGIRKARLLRGTCIGVTLLILVILVLLIVRTLVKKEKTVTVNTVDKDLLQTVNHEVSGLNDIISTKWKIQERTVREIISDLESVVYYYKSMQKEINISDNYDISDTCEVLEKVIEAMLQYIRHAARVLRIMNKSDHNSVTKELDNTATYVKELRDKAQDFIMSVLDYMKDDTAKETALDNISSFKEIVLNEVSLIDEYLNN